LVAPVASSINVAFGSGVPEVAGATEETGEFELLAFDELQLTAAVAKMITSTTPSGRERRIFI
jgi:hypothetical protein